ncbi:MAG: hydroxyneurosporene methyltransferase [Acidobacteria bacterium]|nr:hydroxyneurosporene methyltransferase [Acidobacteriota bacterium]
MDLWALSDLCTPWCIHTVATLRIAEHIDSGTHDIAQLAAAAQCDAYVLGRILDHLVTKEVFDQPSPNHYTLNDTSRQLLDAGTRIGLDLEGFGGRMAHSWSTMLAYVRTGVPAYDDIFGRPFWDDLDEHPEIGAQFDALMGPAGHGQPNPSFPITGGWDGIQTIADVGGGTGAMLAGILKLHPHLKGTLVDQPRTVALSGPVFTEADVADRVTIVGQSFFDPLPAGLDLYLLKGILNDWPDREAIAILKRCAQAAGTKGRVIVLGGIVPEGNLRPLMIEMILVGGKHRTPTEFSALAAQAGLETIIHETGSGALLAECHRH